MNCGTVDKSTCALKKKTSESLFRKKVREKTKEERRGKKALGIQILVAPHFKMTANYLTFWELEMLSKNRKRGLIPLDSYNNAIIRGMQLLIESGYNSLPQEEIEKLTLAYRRKSEIMARENKARHN